MKQLLKDLFKDDESLNIFVRQMAKFDQAFSDNMVSGVDFILKFEIRGDEGKMIHCRSDSSVWDRPLAGKKSRKKANKGIADL